MIAISPLRSSNGINEREEEFIDINFDDLFEGFDDGDVLPDLEIDPSDIFVDFSFTSGGGGSDESETNREKGGPKLDKDSSQGEGEVEVVSARTTDIVSLPENINKGGKSKKISHGKKKAKVDWTPELHRRFVDAVEQLGVDKAVPSRILELMGIDCLTRHNIASHLQKYRSHRKHLLTREAEAAASWTHRRPMHTTTASTGTKRSIMSPNWAPPPIIGFPPPPMLQHAGFRPLHVWGHPSMAEHPQLVPVWPRPPFWHYPHYERPLTPGTPCFPPPPPLMPTEARFQTHVPVTGIPQHPMFRPTPPVPSKHSDSQIRSDFAQRQSSESHVDAAIGDVLAKPWSPLPLGLKPPSLESVVVELQKQGVPDVPPAFA